MPSACASISTISWRRKRRPKRRKLPQPRPNPRRRAPWHPLRPGLPPPLLPQSLPRFRSLPRRRPQVSWPNRLLLRLLLRHRELFRRVRLLSPHLPLMRLRLLRILWRILLRLQNPVLLPRRLLRHPQLRQGPALPLRNGPPRRQDPQALRDNRARRTRSVPPPHPRDSVRQVLARLRPRNVILPALAALPEQDRGVPACHRVTVPAVVLAARRGRVDRAPVDLHPDFRNVRGIAPIKVRSAVSVPAREFPRRSRASRSMRASRRRADVR